MIEKPSLPYKFKLHSATITILLENNSKVYLFGEEGAEKLKEFLSEGIIPESMDTTTEDDTDQEEDIE
ncbi:MAG: hypothetical protein J1E95_08010 [Muribaculaceae bacterium]|nr:hypothetical protein [Muribaculaceae bacterium]